MINQISKNYDEMMEAPRTCPHGGTLISIFRDMPHAGSWHGIYDGSKCPWNAENVRCLMFHGQCQPRPLTDSYMTAERIEEGRHRVSFAPPEIYHYTKQPAAKR